MLARAFTPPPHSYLLQVPEILGQGEEAGLRFEPMNQLIAELIREGVASLNRTPLCRHALEPLDLEL